ncbi:helix-turn-helix domain-containing protein [Larkinella insperata]|uniref:Helix-turn-helix domain-containing protein n=1 Tax=Larkinella insperata TaxID=332158 RepID=A0ABW3Q6I7_9BACT
MNVLKEGIGQRLRYVRKHLSERLGEDLTSKEVANRLGLDRLMILRMEDGLRGKTESLVLLLKFYRQYGYNPIWILEDTQQDVQMILTPGISLIEINETLEEFEQLFTAGRAKFVEQMNKLGFQPGDKKILSMNSDFNQPQKPI